MNENLSSPGFVFFVIPILASLLVLGLKLLSRVRKPGGSTLDREDYLIGTELGVSACLINLLNTFDRLRLDKLLNAQMSDANTAKKTELVDSLLKKSNVLSDLIEINVIVVFLLVIGLVAIAYCIQRWGWEGTGVAQQLRRGRGIIFPNLAGVLFLVLVTAVAGKTI